MASLQDVRCARYQAFVTSMIIVTFRPSPSRKAGKQADISGGKRRLPGKLWGSRGVDYQYTKW